MNLFVYRASSVATGALAILTLASCDGSQLASVNSDRIVPSVSTEITNSTGTSGIDSVSVRAPLQVKVSAQDNAALLAVTTRVFADEGLVKTDSVSFPVASTDFSKTLSISLAGVTSGQVVRVVTRAVDGTGNVAVDTVAAVAFDPNVPKLSFSRAASSAIPGGTFAFDLVVSDTSGVAKTGYVASGAGVQKSDSALFTSPLPKTDTASFQLDVPGSASIGGTITITPFAENRDGLRVVGDPIAVQVVAPGADVTAPLVYQTMSPRLETADTIEVFARDSDGRVRIVGFAAKDSTGATVFESADTLSAPVQQVTRRMVFGAPTSLRGQRLIITAYAIDAVGNKGWAVPTGATVPATSETVAKHDAVVYAFGLTYALPSGSLGADIAVDTARATLYISNINKNELEAFSYGSELSPLPSVSVGAMPWGMIIDNSNSLLLVANSGGTNISKVNLFTRRETGRVKTSNEWVYDVKYAKDETSGGFKYTVTPPIDYSDRPQNIAQSASGALYYSTRPTSSATPGTLRRIDNFLDSRAEPRQIWQYGAYAKGHYVILNSDFVDVILGQNGVPDSITICDHTPGDQPSTAVCVQSLTVEGAVAALRSAPVNGNVEAVKDLDVTSLELPDTNFVAVGGDRRRIAFGEGHTGSRAGRVLLAFDPSGTPPDGAIYSAPMEVVDLTNNASDKVFGIDINRNSNNFAVHGVETFFADSSLRLQGKFATFSSGAGVVFHPNNVDENTSDSAARVAFVASGDMSIQIVDTYSYRLRGRIPIRTNLYGPLRAAFPTAAERAANPDVVLKLFGLTPEGVVVIDVRADDIDNVPQ